MEYSDLYVKRISQLCKSRGISVNKLSTMSGVKQSTLDNIMRGITKNPGVKAMHRVANAFNMTFSEFVNIKGINEYSFDDEE